ncbi:DUF6894 family protein [Paracoccus sp. (in: a-proteobacteria)]|uniref:DUF6894 family protein n=1 Tax=Paracoccus sp. TaxID=267 RepID=UPI00396C7E5B
MQKLFFHLVYDGRTIEDPEGSDFSDLATAHAEARAGIRDLAAEHLTAGKPFRLKHVRISTCTNQAVAEVSAAEAVRQVIAHETCLLIRQQMASCCVTRPSDSVPFAGMCTATQCAC